MTSVSLPDCYQTVTRLCTGAIGAAIVKGLVLGEWLGVTVPVMAAASTDTQQHQGEGKFNHIEEMHLACTTGQAIFFFHFVRSTLVSFLQLHPKLGTLPGSGYPALQP